MLRLVFGDCILDPETRVLLRDGRPVHLTPKAFEFLALLIARRPRAIAKADFMDELWPGVAVTEGSLANVVSEVRLATGDTARQPRYVRTVHRFGYAFCGDARELGPDAMLELVLPARFRLVSAEGETDLVDGDHLIGRADDCRLRIQSTTVSRHHARVSVRGDEVLLEDLGSKNGTWVSGRKVDKPMPLKGGDEIQVGSITVRFAISSPLATTDSYILRVKA
jgi:DNA-binding winged helix-turn-helix (wHTH) protein